MEVKEYIEKIKSINKNVDIEKLEKAFHYAQNAHEGQLRKSGEPFFIHPLAVSLIVAELEVDSDTIVACLLHDTIEDTDASFEDIEAEFGHSVAQLVDGVTKLTKMHYETKQEIQVENLRKMFLAMAKDIRVILIKLVDRLHNMRTLKYQSESKKQEKALETLEIYVPIAHRLGIFKIKGELEDLCLLYLEPESYYELSSKINKKLSERKTYIDKVIEQISDSLDEIEMSYEVYGRPKNFYSIYKKLKYQKKEFSEIYDITAIRILVDTVKDCYAALGTVHTLWKPMPGRFKDYIAMPKPNMYRSLHTTVMGNEGEPFEVQIRTQEMHKVSEYGIAAHFNYKEAKKGMNNIDEKLVWLRQMMEWQGDIDNPEEFLDSLKIDILNHQVYVFTPQSSVVELPEGSTPVDFAYKIHTEVGNKCVGAKVNGRIVPLNFKLSTGEIVEILTQKNSNGPSRDWLTFVKSTQAKNKIKHWFKKERREENIEKGRDMIEKEIRKAGFKVSDLMVPKWLDPLMARLSVYSIDDLYATIGYGGIMMNQVLPKLKEAYKKEHKIDEIEIKELESKKEDRRVQEKNSKRAGQSVIVKGLDDLLIRFARCCTPVPGDDIIGYITRGRGVTVHRADCKNFESTDEMKSRFIEVAWQVEETATFTTEIQVIAPDRKGLLSEVTSIITAINLVVTGVSAKLLKSGVAVINLSIEVSDINKLNSLLNRLNTLENIIEVKRVTS
ncbi:MAG: bifunctional (p)ppGpp synthetase/guanosine-3',5'-bis(diphosphate) 3'-pyrophosphohydrolase [Clostridiales bacterium]|nr:bifunctional (p)ppGpp synthetase/guanosine-3',5'-bis(diphosphate) 3'-pyrophosphohydrolase [Clostridiales bacterium]